MQVAESFVDTIAYVLAFVKTADTQRLSCEQVRDRILAQMSAGRRDIEVDEATYEQARFALCAWIDEVLSGSGWSERDAWVGNTLQRQLYGTDEAGTLFFERLAALPRHLQEVREVYYLCLALGFTGQYASESDRLHLEEIRTKTLKQLTGHTPSAGTRDATLFPAAYAAAPGMGSRIIGQLSLRRLSAIILPPAILAALYGLYAWLFIHMGHGVLSRLGQ